jgi:hypothetical protein
MIDQREEAFKNISRILAITRYDIEQRQSVNDLSLNIHGENYFRDVFNFVYEYEFENDNFNTQNSSCVDLVDKKNKLAYQITTTRTKEKIIKTFKTLDNKKYEDYEIKILYLLEKANPNKDTIAEFKKEHDIDLGECLLDYTDLIRKINDLDTSRLLELNNKYFKNNSEKYTDEIVLNLVFNHLIKNSGRVQKNYDDDFGSIDTKDKIIINDINPRVSNKINSGFDFVSIVRENDDDTILTDLRTLIIENIYKDVLLEHLGSYFASSDLTDKSVNDLQELANDKKLNFNKIINDLHKKIEDKIDITDYNSMSISWIIISFFFEICDIGIRK